MFCHLFSILRLRGGGGSTGTTAQGLHMSKSGPGRKDYIGCEERTNRVVYTSNELAQYGKISNISQCIDPVLKAQLQNVGILI